MSRYRSVDKCTSRILFLGCHSAVRRVFEGKCSWQPCSTPFSAFSRVSWAAVGCELLLSPISEGSERSQRTGLVWASPGTPCASLGLPIPHPHGWDIQTALGQMDEVRALSLCPIQCSSLVLVKESPTPCSPLAADSFHARGWEVTCSKVLVPFLGAVLSQHSNPHRVGPLLTAVPHFGAEQGIETLVFCRKSCLFLLDSKTSHRSVSAEPQLHLKLGKGYIGG